MEHPYPQTDYPRNQWEGPKMVSRSRASSPKKERNKTAHCVGLDLEEINGPQVQQMRVKIALAPKSKLEKTRWNKTLMFFRIILSPKRLYLQTGTNDQYSSLGSVRPSLKGEKHSLDYLTYRLAKASAYSGNVTKTSQDGWKYWKSERDCTCLTKSTAYASLVS